MNEKSILGVVVLSVFLINGCIGNFFIDSGFFISAFIKNPTMVGSVIPSSSFLSNSIVKYIGQKKDPIRILEVGAGTGAFTEKIMEKITDKDIFDVIEIDEQLCDILKDKCKDYANVHVHCLSILDWKPLYEYDFIISGLPFNSFDSEFVVAVLDTYKDIIKDNGICSYFEYMWAADIKKIFLSGEKKVDYIKNIEARIAFIDEFNIDMDFVFFNIPPAYVYHLQIKK